MKNKIKILVELTKLRITLFVTVTTAFGFISYAGGFTLVIIPTVIGILLLACGSAVINHYQERATDALMDRTKNRPIPAGKITPPAALTVAVVLIITGSIVLFFGSGWLAMVLSLLNLIWYNGIYTPLKKVNPLAIIPGSIVGAIPPAVGWVAAGGSLLDPQLSILAFFFFIWQIPHFWLLLLVFDKDYEKAGFPTLTKIFNHQQLARITFIWIIATVVTSFLIPLFGIVNSQWINIGLLAAGVWLCWDSINLLRQSDGKISFKFAFMHINYFALSVVLLLSIDKLVI
ncbi:MAG: protoheme IX farnesyltransferase [Ignavibacteriaceae bacterium]|nr:protoheme IX farnesyltransferase [Ignavibacteriaceae bacterium]